MHVYAQNSDINQVNNNQENNANLINVMNSNINDNKNVNNSDINNSNFAKQNNFRNVNKSIYNINKYQYSKLGEYDENVKKMRVENIHIYNEFLNKQVIEYNII